MREKKIILHVGAPKTGTTSLQTVLCAQSESLTQAGIHYLKSMRASVSHNRLIMKISKDDEEARKAKRKVLHEIDANAGPTFLLSSEIAFGAKQTSQLLDVFTETYQNIDIILYMRRQDLFLEAMAKQKLKSGHYKGTLEDFISKRANRGNYMSYINAVRKKYPHVTIECRPYDRRELINGDIIADFWSYLGLTYTPIAQSAPTSVNVTPCRELAEALGAHEFASPHHRRSVIGEIHAKLPHLFRSKDIMNAQQRQIFMEKFRLENRALSEFCGYDIEKLFNDSVDFEKESNHTSDATDRRELEKQSKDAVAAAALHRLPQNANR